ncbi:MAG: hypothetical protein CALGDGBN_01308 [Pseudomonadales bacterium]|nr:hypothetical protein [Pseudomonadales bacterium]
MIRTASHSWPRVTMLLALALLGAAPVQADEAPDVRRLMSPEEFRDAGLERLSPVEIEALNAWVLRYTATEAPLLRSNNTAVREAETGHVIRSRIAGEFRGWTGHTEFALENGQLWRQRSEGKYYFRASSPEVEIHKNALGFWHMRVIPADRGVGVKRVR